MVNERMKRMTSNILSSLSNWKTSCQSSANWWLEYLFMKTLIVDGFLKFFFLVDRGLKTDELASLEKKFSNLNLLHSKQEHFFEVDTQGIRVLNILSGDDFNYRITSQSMAMEKTDIGGRTIQVQKLVWTLGKQEM